MKKKILIASLLKPVDDVRSYWKLSKSMSKTNKYDINIIGNATKKLPSDPSVHFSTYLIKRDNFFKRWFRSSTLFLPFCKLKPDLLIITSAELIFSSLICKAITGCKIIYDVQEDYKANLTISNQGFSRKWMGIGIRFLEQASSLFIDHYWLAESCYESALKFTAGKSTVIQNKAVDLQIPVRKPNRVRLLFSGTISEYAGIKLAVSWYQKIKEIEANTFLSIIGQVHDPLLFEWLKELEKKDTSVKLKISSQPIPHPEILQEISAANLGLISYEENNINRNKVPTKLYEYSRYKLPFLLVRNSSWAEIGSRLGGAIAIDPSFPEAQKVLNIHRDPSNLFPKDYPKSETWEFESMKLISSIETILNK